jgi:hypothetical protein
MKNGLAQNTISWKKVWVIFEQKTIKRRKIQESYIDRIEKASLRWLLER